MAAKTTAEIICKEIKANVGQKKKKSKQPPWKLRHNG